MQDMGSTILCCTPSYAIYLGESIRDAALGAVEVRPHSGQARQQILILGQLDLRLGVRRPCAAREDVEDEQRAVEHERVQRLLDVLLLRRLQVVVDNHGLYVVLFDILPDLFELAGAHIGPRVGHGQILREALDGGGSGRLDQECKLVEVLVDLLQALARRADRNQHHAFQLPVGG